VLWGLGFLMRILFVLMVVSILLTGCVTERELPGREPYWNTAETAQGLNLLTPAIVKECSAHVEKMFTRPIKFVGPFTISALAAYKGAERQFTVLGPDHSAEDTVAVIAPTNSTTPFGTEASLMAGCLYRLRDNRLVFEKAKIFGRRIGMVQVDPEKAKRSQSER
jgi:hypothetical protein